MRKRPVYAIDNRALEPQVGALVPLWRPGGNVEQFRALLPLLKVTLLESSKAAVTDPFTSFEDGGADDELRRAVSVFQDCLVRDEPKTARDFHRWPVLDSLTVRIQPQLQITLPTGESTPPLDVPAQAHIDVERCILFLTHREALRTARGAGQAIADLFDRDRQRVAYLWRDAWEQLDADRRVASTRLTSASQRDFDAEQQVAALHAERERTLAQHSEELPTKPRLRRQADQKGGRTPAPGTTPKPAQPTARPFTAPAPASGPRKLFNIDSLGQFPHRSSTSEAESASLPTQASRSRTGANSTDLPQPRPAGAATRQSAGVRQYTDRDREVLAIELLRGALLSTKGVELQDHSGQLGLGADAVDDDGHYYEIKAHAGAAPDAVTLTGAEYNRALQQGVNFSLVVASHLEEGGPNPQLHIITDPLSHLDLEPTEHLRLRGVLRSSPDRQTYEW